MIFAPIVLLLGRLFRRGDRQPGDPFRVRGYWLLAIWVIAQCAATALLRGGGWQVPPSRYADLFAFGVLLNFCALLSLLGVASTSGRWRPVAIFAALGWVIFAGLGLARQTQADFTAQLPRIRAILQMEEENVRGFVLTGDPAFVEGKKYPEIPYSDSSTIIRVLADPNFRAILPPALLREPGASAAPPPRARGPLTVVSDFLLEYAGLVLAAGITLCLLNLLGARLNQRRILEQASRR